MARVQGLEPYVVGRRNVAEDTVTKSLGGVGGLLEPVVRLLQPRAPLGRRCGAGRRVHGLIRLAVDERVVPQDAVEEQAAHERTHEPRKGRERTGLTEDVLA